MKTPCFVGSTRAVSWAVALLLAVLMAPHAATGDEPSAPRPAKPNVVLIVADDLGYADVGFHGCRDIPTPNIDSIAEGGVRFPNGYVSCPVCSPTRAGLLTGRYQQRFGHEFNPRGSGTDGSPVGLPTTEQTLPTLLKEAGYVTGAVGKWHLGQAEEFHPQARGFDEFFGFLSGARPYFDGFSRVRSPLMRGREEVVEDEYLTDAFGREAVAFIERHKDRPFFLYLPFNAVHTPMEAPPKYVDRFPDIHRAKRRTYAAMTSAMDDAIGCVLATLRKHGLEENTLVVFLGDNGGPTAANGSSNDPLRAGKSTLFEGGVRVPFAIRWPARLPAGTIYDPPVISLDIAPTAVAAGSGTLPDDRVIDGVDLIPHVLGETVDAPHASLFWRTGRRHAVRHGDWKLVVDRSGTPALFDLAEDVGEEHDRTADQPEILARLQRLYDAWNAEMVEPRWGAGTRKRGKRRR